jgi:aquaporin Z
MLMTVVLFSSNSPRLLTLTPALVACLVALYVTFEAPLSGMSMNPARSAASAVGARYFTSLWIYFTAPVIGMMAAAELFLRLRRGVAPICAKLHHANNQRCIFRCGYKQHAAEAHPAAAN